MDAQQDGFGRAGTGVLRGICQRATDRQAFPVGPGRQWFHELANLELGAELSRR